jgi:hypothetical protein
VSRVFVAFVLLPVSFIFVNFGIPDHFPLGVLCFLVSFFFPNFFVQDVTSTTSTVFCFGCTAFFLGEDPAHRPLRELIILCISLVKLAESVSFFLAAFGNCQIRRGGVVNEKLPVVAVHVCVQQFELFMSQDFFCVLGVQIVSSLSSHFLSSHTHLNPTTLRNLPERINKTTKNGQFQQPRLRLRLRLLRPSV